MSALARSGRRIMGPWPKLLVGSICLGFAVLGTLLQIQTSEAFLLHGQIITFAPDWIVVGQPLTFLLGPLSITSAKAIVWAWGVEVLFLIVVLGYEVAHAGVVASHPRLARGFRLGTLALLILNAVSDYSFGQIGSGALGHLGFALIIAFAILFLGVAGIRFLERAIAQMSGGAPLSVAASPLPKLAVGVMALVLFFLVVLFQIQTSESFFLNTPSPAFFPNWQILIQPFLLFAGRLPAATAMAVMWGWIIETVFLICVVGYEIAHEGVMQANTKLAPWFRTGMFIILVFDAFSDFLYGTLPSGWLGQLAFAGMMSFIVFFFGTSAVHLIARGVTDWTK